MIATRWDTQRVASNFEDGSRPRWRPEQAAPARPPWSPHAGPRRQTPTDAEWNEFLGHFQHRKIALGTCGRAYNTPCIHEHSCLRCPLLRPDPAQRARLTEIHDNLLARIDEAHHEGWLGEVDGLNISLAGARQKLAQLDELTTRAETVHLGMPHVTDLVGRTVT